MHANRGANGIDGVVSTGDRRRRSPPARPTVVLLGDVALLPRRQRAHRRWPRRDVDLTIVVVDNDGGGIFSFLPSADQLAADRFEQLFGTPHGTDLVALAAAHGLPATTATTVDELTAALAVAGRAWSAWPATASATSPRTARSTTRSQSPLG